MSITKKVVLVLIAGSPTLCWGLGVRVADQNPFASSRGNAFVATANNPSAIFYNPAGITQLQGQQLLFGAYGIGIDIDYTSPSGQSVSNEEEIKALPQFYYTFTPKNSQLTVGLGAYSPFGLGLEYPDDSPFRTLTRKGSIKYLTVSPAAAWQFHRQFSIGVAATINGAEAELTRGVFQTGDEFRFKGTGTSYGFNIGARWEPTPQHAFGVTYHSASEMEFSGHSTVKTQTAFVPTPFGPFEVPAIDSREYADVRFQFPQYLVFGYSFRPTPAWNFEVNVDWTDWDSLNTLNLRQQRSANVSLPFNWQSSFFYEGGITYYFGHGFRSSVGYIYSENSVPQDDFNPVVPDSNRHIMSIGIGQTTGHFTWDLAYQFARSPEREIENNTAANGTYRFTSHAVTLSLGYNF